jgi:uncharacterized repeat protein (TIGR04042 family)
MPEMRFIIRWPDGRQQSCYSPSLVIRDFLREGESYPVSDFLQRCREALQIASERVKAKYGYPVRWRSANSGALKRQPRNSRGRTTRA